MYNRGEVYTYVLVQQSGSANSIVATISGVYVVDHPEVCTCIAYSGYMSREIAVCTIPVPVTQLLSFAQR